MYCPAGIVSSTVVASSRAPSGRVTDVPPSDRVPPSAPICADVLWASVAGHERSLGDPQKPGRPNR